MNCPYCSSEVVYDDGYYCSFCNVEFKKDELTFDGHRKVFHEQKQFMSSYDLDLSLKELKELHTVNLLELLFVARSERSNEYNLLRTINKSLDQGLNQFKDAASEQGKNYEYFTRKAWVIENLLIERMGWYPKRLTRNFLDDFKKKCSESMTKQMNITRTRKVESQS